VEINLISDEEVSMLLKDVMDIYGYDFTNYSRASVKRRINRVFHLAGIASFAELRYAVRNNPIFLQYFVEQLTVNVTEMFRDPSFYKLLRNEVLPRLGTYPLIRIWHAGCSTGEEVYSMAIMLKELNLFHKSMIYATDINPTVIEKAGKGIYPLSQMQKYSENYLMSGGQMEFSKYYTASYHHAKFNEELRSKMIFSTHNLVSDYSFNQFQLIMCRNTLIYFDKDLQAKVFQLFDTSLESLGYLALGSKETIRFSPIASRFVRIDPTEKIWKKIV